jgi:two-component system sensor histidine kinase RegB
MAATAATLVSSATNLRRLLLLRLFMIAAQLMTFAIAFFALYVELPYAALLSVTALYALALGLSWYRLRLPWPVSEAELFAQLLLDVVVLTMLLYLSGGSTNPFVMLYLLPLSLTAAALPGRFTWAMLGVTALCYTLLLIYYRPLPEVHVEHSDAFTLHVVGMWLGYLLGAALIAYFAVRMADTLRERDRLRAAMREQELKHERVLALGTLAAGAAHELGTPLSTMAVLAKELETDATQTVDGKNKLSVLRAQIERCKEILGTLSASAGASRAEGGAGRVLDAYLRELIERLRSLRPGVQVRLNAEGAQPAPRLVVDQTLSQAILNVLNNAADASPDHVEVDLRWDAERFEILICDRGPGIEPALAAVAGEDVLTTKDPGQGLGLGLFLAHTTVQRLGGAIRLYNREGGGACTQLWLPLAPLCLSSP